VNKYLNIKLCKTIEANQTSIKNCVPLDLTEQAFILSKFEILPRRLRAFIILFFFTYVDYNTVKPAILKRYRTVTGTNEPFRYRLT
jgi:uncharacterized membrane protein YwaF